MTGTRGLLLAGWIVTALVGGGLAAAEADQPKPGTGPLRRATFELTNEVTVKVPEGARRVRVWMALPQDNDPAQQVKDLKIEAPVATRIERDSEGSRILYLEMSAPTVKEFTVVETFTLTRSEIRDQIDATKARPLTDADRA